MSEPDGGTRWPGLSLYRYVAVEALQPAAFAVLGLTVVLLTQDLMGFANLVLNRGLSSETVALIGFYKAVPIAALMFPFAVLIGCLVALGRMGADREILALESLGVPADRLVWPSVAFAAAMMVASLFLSLWASPASVRNLDDLLEEVATERPWAQIRQGTVSRFGDWRLEAREVNAAGDHLEGILIFMPEVGETIFAQEGDVSTREDGRIELSMTGGSVVRLSPDGAQNLRFDRMATVLPNAKEGTLDERDRIRGLTLAQLRERASEFEPTETNRLSRAAVEYQRRFAMPVACLVFGMLAVPLLHLRKTFSRSGGGVLGLFCTIFYYGLVQFGEGLAQSELVGAVAAAWFPNVVLLIVAIGLLVRPRGEEISARSTDRPQQAVGAVGALRSGGELLLRPQRRYPLPRYIAERFVRLAGLAFAVLLVAYLLIDVMDRLEWFSRYQASGSEILRFYAVRVVLLASRVVPMSLLVATALTVSLLAVEGELIGMRACGIPAPRALLPVLIIAALVVPFYAFFINVLVPRTNAAADHLKKTEIKGAFYRELDAKRKSSVWRRSGNQVLEAAHFDPDRGVSQDLSIYELGADRLPVARTDAASARHIGGGQWLLERPRRVEIVEAKQVRDAAAEKYAYLGDSLPAEVDTMHLSVAEIGALIDEAEADDVDSRELRVDYNVKLAEPLACVVLPALVLFFAVGGPPFPGPAQTLLASVISAVGYILLTGVSRSLGYGGTVPAVVGGWGPVFAFSAVSAFFGARLWRRL